MAGGGKIRIADRDNTGEMARVVNGRLLVTTQGGGGVTSDVNISEVGGVAIGATVPVSGTVNVGNFPATVAVTQSTSPWVVSGTVASSLAGLVSAANSTTALLGSGATFTGTFEDVRDYSAVSITILANVASASNGFHMQWSHDGVNIDRDETFTVAANVGRAFAIPVEGRFFRVSYTNGGSAQATFRLGTVYKQGHAGLNAVTLDQDLDTTGAMVVGTRSVITGETTGGGGGFVNVKVNPSGTLAIDGSVTQGTSPWVVSGTVAVTQSTSPWVVGGSVSIIGSVTVSSITTGVVPGVGTTNLGKQEDAIHGSGDTGVAVWGVRSDAGAALAASGDYIPFMMNSVGSLFTAVTSIVPGTAAANLGKAEDALHASGDTGVMALAVRNDAGTLFAANGDYIPLSVNSSGNLRVDLATINSASFVTVPISGSVSVSAVIPGTGPTHLGKSEDDAHTGGETGVLIFGVRRDTPSSLVGADNDYIPFTTDSVGAVWVRNRGDFVTTLPFSASTRGRPVQITATATAGTTIHVATTTAGQIDRIYIYLTNTSSSAVTVTFEFGTTGAANNVSVQVPANATILAIDGAVIGGAATDTVAAFASTGSVINAIGRVERLVA